MRILSVSEIVKAVSGQLVTGSYDFPVFRIATDSRKTAPGDCFFALVGKVNDAHQYIEQVLDSGCQVLVVSNYNAIPKEAFLGQYGDPSIILVEDTTKAFLELGRFYLGSLKQLKKKIAVTGSVGKTSTRDLLYSAVSTKYVSAKCRDNFNNAFGLPLSIIDFPEETEVAVLEMGMSVRDSIGVLSEMARPDISIITNVGIAHMENFPEDGREGILKTKLQVAKYLTSEGTLIINADGDVLTKESAEGDYKLITVGTRPEFDYYIHDIDDFGERGINFQVTRRGETFKASIPLPGAHNAVNSGLAIACAELIGITIEDAIKGIAGAEITGKRMKIAESNGIKIIDDTYNAGPESMRSAISTLMHIEGKRHIAILADMRELGEMAAKSHIDLGLYAGEMGVDVVLCTGEFSRLYGGVHFENRDELILYAKDFVKEGDVVLVKGSNSFRMGEVVKALLNK